MEPGDTEDFQWIQAFQAGKEEGFNRLVLKHKDRIYGLCLRLLAGNQYEAEDSAQETFVRVYQGLPAFRMESKFSSWVYRIAVNTCKNKWASKSWQNARQEQDIDSMGANANSDGGIDVAVDREWHSPSPSDILEAKVKSQRIEAAIARLPDEQRILVVLRDIEGRSYEEIAETTGLNPGTVKSRLNRGRGQLQEWLRDCLLAVLVLAMVWMDKLHG
jgi:RNA polymerase sigma-70 factor, ECF subfamily